MKQKIVAIVDKLVELLEDKKNRKENGDYFDLFVTGHRWDSHSFEVFWMSNILELLSNTLRCSE